MLLSRTTLLAAVSLTAASSLSAVELAPLFVDNAVLQRGKEVAVWGKGKPGEKISVQFAGQDKSATVDAAGLWSVKLDGLTAAKDGRELTVKGDTTIVLKDVLVGEVWICSGQSNMEMTVGRTLDAANEIAAANLPTIRQVKVPTTNSATPVTSLKLTWVAASPKTAGDFTAAGFYFAREVAKALDVPVGLISSNWGGTRIEPWTNAAGFHSVPELKSIADQVDSWDPTTELGSKAHLEFLTKLKAWIPLAETAATARQAVPPMPQAPVPGVDQQQPTKLWNGMINPLVPYGIRGALWYQGEANGGEGPSYTQKMQALVGCWRQAFGQGEFPFYFVQLANWQTSDPAQPQGGDGWSRVREAQRAALAAIPHTGMAVTIDIGEGGDIHPKNKQEVGHRLAQWALANDYAQPVESSGPLFKAQAIEGATIRVSFDHADAGLMVGSKKGLKPTEEVKDGALTWWAIAGEDKVWKKAVAKIDGATVVVSSPDVAKPVAVRYAFAMNPDGCNLYNKVGLPASPFRTDTW